MIPAMAAMTSSRLARGARPARSWARSVTSRGWVWAVPPVALIEGRRLVQALLVAVRAVHGGARLGEQDGGGAADAAGGAGDECGAAGEVVRRDGHGGRYECI